MTTPLSEYEQICREACEWCALHIDGDRKVTAVLERSRPNPVHEVYPPHVKGRFSIYLLCLAPTRDQVITEQAQRIRDLEAQLKDYATKYVTRFSYEAVGKERDELRAELQEHKDEKWCFNEEHGKALAMFAFLRSIGINNQQELDARIAQIEAARKTEVEESK